MASEDLFTPELSEEILESRDKNETNVGEEIIEFVAANDEVITEVEVGEDTAGIEETAKVEIVETTEVECEESTEFVAANDEVITEVEVGEDAEEQIDETAEVEIRETEVESKAGVDEEKLVTTNESGGQETRLIQLPLARIRNLMKLDPDLHIASAESVFVITRATELFIESLARESFSYTTQSKKKTVQKRDVELAISSVDSLMFLDGAMNF